MLDWSYVTQLQLRQAKLFFPSVYLMVGVCADDLVKRHKAQTVLTSEERYESVRNCKWSVARALSCMRHVNALTRSGSTK